MGGQRGHQLGHRDPRISFDHADNAAQARREVGFILDIVRASAANERRLFVALEELEALLLEVATQILHQLHREALLLLHFHAQQSQQGRGQKSARDVARNRYPSHRLHRLRGVVLHKMRLHGRLRPQGLRRRSRLLRRSLLDRRGLALQSRWCLGLGHGNLRRRSFGRSNRGFRFCHWGLSNPNFRFRSRRLRHRSFGNRNRSRLFRRRRSGSRQLFHRCCRRQRGPLARTQGDVNHRRALTFKPFGDQGLVFFAADARFVAVQGQVVKLLPV